jgi:uncharacterized membrane protein YphA (DoxX/SURF4 family)
MSKFSGDPGYQAFRVLQFVFVVAPILAGLDKFCNLLTNWSQYISPFVMHTVGGRVHGFMMLVGVIEIVAGVLVAVKPKIFSYIVALWLLLIIINLLMKGQYYDIALRDFGLMLSAYSLGRLSKKYA